MARGKGGGHFRGMELRDTNYYKIGNKDKHILK